VVSHTHWDREWYLPATRFRQRLVALVDELLDDPPLPGTTFLLDGQMVVIEDYLDVRPERRAEIAALLARGAIEAGPWFVLADELIPGGEALVRNLQAGRRAIAALGGTAPPVLYCPDSFGHPAALPSLAAGFGLGVVVASRGYGGARWPDGDAARWAAPSGEEVYLYHLSRKGYDVGENLPPSPQEARARWASLRQDIVDRARTSAVLLPNGADHHARQRRLTEAIAALAAAAHPHDVKQSSLTAFARDWVPRAARADVPVVRGELRDSYGFVWTLQGTFGTRAHQKRRNTLAERLLTRDAEPWAALARVARGRDRQPLVRAAWKSLLLCHPHDTLCGCSTDEVARAMDVRLDEVIAQGAGIRDDALLDLAGHDPDAARERRGAWVPVTLVRNPAPRPRGGVAVVRLVAFAQDVKVGANASPGPVHRVTPRIPALAHAGTMQVLGQSLTHERTEAPRHYPDDDLVLSADVAVWIPEVPSYGLRAFPHQARAARVAPPNPARVRGRAISNGLLSLDVGAAGRVTLRDHGTGRRVAPLIAWESRVDRGDLYTPSIRSLKLRPRHVGTRVVHRGPLRASIETSWVLRAGLERVDATVTFILDADAEVVRIHVAGTNDARHHRLRLGVATGVAQARVWADAMFGPVERTPPKVAARDAAMERPPLTQPLHRYVTLGSTTAGATVFSDGLGEYEAGHDGRVFVTLVRAVGALSRDDLPERRGHAGWPTATPEAQCQGPFSAELAVMLHGPRDDTVIDAVERTADDVLLPLTGATLRSALAVPEAVHGAMLTGTGLACSAVKTAEDGQWLVLRCVNLTDRLQRGSWTVGFKVREAQLARLDETPLGRIAGRGNQVGFVAPPRAAVTILVR
jgi:alpha-mannosidase